MHRNDATDRPPTDSGTQWRAPYRAAYWRAYNRTTGWIVLTQREHSACPTGMLCQVARQQAARIGITLSMGGIVIIDGNGAFEMHETIRMPLSAEAPESAS